MRIMGRIGLMGPMRQIGNFTVVALSLFKPNFAKASRKVKIKFIHWRPRSPVRMRNLFGAFEKVPAPHLSVDVSELARERFKEAKWDEELQGPNCRLRHLFFNNGWQRSARLNLPPNFPWKFGKLLETARPAFRIDDVIAQKRATTIEFKIEITTIGFRLRKKLDATVFPYFVEIIRPDAPNVAILHLKNSVDSFVGIQQLCERPRPVVAALRAKVRHFKRWRWRPNGIFPSDAERQIGKRLLNGILAWLIQGNCGSSRRREAQI